MIEAGLQLTLGGAGMAAALTMANDHVPGVPIIKRLVVAVLGAWGVLMALTAVLQFVPVVAGMEAREVARSPGRVLLSVDGEKQRKGCTFLGAEAYSSGKTGMQKAWVSFPHDPSPGATRPVGRQSFGEWLIEFDEGAGQSSVTIVSHHNCGRLLGLTRTEAGPFNITKL